MIRLLLVVAAALVGRVLAANPNCPPPTIQGCQAPCSFTIAGTGAPPLTGTFSSSCPTLTFSYSVAGSGTVANTGYLTKTGTGSTQAFTWTASALPTTQGPYTFTVTSCGTGYICSTSTTTVYIFRSGCPQPTLTYPSGNVYGLSPTIVGTYTGDASYCDQLKLYSTNPQGQTYSLPISTQTLSGGAFTYNWNGNPLAQAGAFTFWIVLSSSVYRGQATSAKVAATIINSAPPTCLAPTITYGGGPQITTLGGADIGGTYQPGCPQINLYQAGVLVATYTTDYDFDQGNWDIFLNPGTYTEGTSYALYATSIQPTNGPAYPASPESNTVNIQWWNFLCQQPNIQAPTSGAVISTTTTPAVSGVLYASFQDIGDCTVLNVYFDGATSPSAGTGSVYKTDPTDSEELFTYTPSTALSQGQHTVYAEITGSTGRPGFTYFCTTDSCRGWQSFTIDTIPAIAYPPDQSTVYSLSPTVNGTIPPGYQSQVTITLQPAGGFGFGKRATYNAAVNANSNGFWTYTFPSVNPGKYALNTGFTNAAGQTSTLTRIITITAPAVNSKRASFIKRSICPLGFEECSVALSTGRRHSECVPSLQTNLEMCGACNGPDCTLIEGVDTVQCIRGECVVGSCLEGYEMSGNECIKSIVIQIEDDFW